MTQDTGFSTALFSGRLPWTAYADLLAQHFFLYESLEQAAQTMVDDPIARAFIVPGLPRLPAIAADLDFLCGTAWSTRIAALPATTTYCTRLRDVAFHQPSRFVAHLYARHRHDLRAGPGLARAVATAYGLHHDGDRFLTFQDRDPDQLRDRYRRLLAQAPWPPAEHAGLRAEIDYAHQLYARVLDELGERWTPTDTQPTRVSHRYH